MAKINKDDLKIGVTFTPCSECGRVEVVHGRWINSKGETVPLDEGCPVSSCNCSVCGEWLMASDEYACIGKYCPNCGAKMDGDGNAVPA